MKNALIGMLSLALALAAFLTRPTEDDFRAFARTHGPGLAKAQFHDCWLWVEVSVEGRTMYAGLLNHWWDKSGGMERA